VDGKEGASRLLSAGNLAKSVDTDTAGRATGAGNVHSVIKVKGDLGRPEKGETRTGGCGTSFLHREPSLDKRQNQQNKEEVIKEYSALAR